MEKKEDMKNKKIFEKNVQTLCKASEIVAAVQGEVSVFQALRISDALHSVWCLCGVQGELSIF